MGMLLKFLLGFIGTLVFLYWLHFYAPNTNTPFAPSTTKSYTTITQKTMQTVPDDSISNAVDWGAFEANDTLFPYSTVPCSSSVARWREDSLRSEYVLSIMLGQVQKGQLNQALRQWTTTDTIISPYDQGSKGYYQCDTINGQHYLRIQIHSFQGNRQYLYQAVDTGWRQLVYYANTDNITIPSDSLQDLNGDGYVDYWVYHYPSSGCCLRNVYQVYVYNPTSKMMQEVGRLLNPTFYPEDQLIRGFGYGHGDDMDLYTYHWNAYDLDTLELIEPPKYNRLDTSSIVRLYWNNGVQEISVLDSVPIVYRTIKGGDWIMY